MSKDFVFYSNYCQHSKKLLDMLSKNNMLEHFELCCVDSNDVQFSQSVLMAVAVWNGSNRELNGQKGIAGWMLLKFN